MRILHIQIYGCLEEFFAKTAQQKLTASCGTLKADGLEPIAIHALRIIAHCARTPVALRRQHKASLLGSLKFAWQA